MAPGFRVAVCLIVLGLSSVLAGSAQALTFQTIHSFCAKSHCTDGALPNPAVAMDGSGNLYGTTFIGGFKNHGVAFKLRPDPKKGWAYEVVWTFCDLQCSKKIPHATSTVIADQNGNIYGVRNVGQEPYEVFEISADGVYSTLHTFQPGEFPSGPPTYAGALQGLPYDGTSPLYGTVMHAVYSLTPSGNGWTRQTLYVFCSLKNCKDGDNASTPPILESSGDLLGTAARGGGSNSAGVIYRLTPSNGSWTETVLHKFCQVAGCTDGGAGIGPLTEDSDGNLFGTNATGGDFQQGTVYELSHSGKFAVLYSFCSAQSCTDGAAPSAVTLGPDGNLYGTAAGGGRGYGVVFEVAGNTETVVHTFCSEANCADGEVPVSQLLRDGSGNLFGTTRGGGANRSLEGTVFELLP